MWFYNIYVYIYYISCIPLINNTHYIPIDIDPVLLVYQTTTYYLSIQPNPGISAVY